MQIGKYSFKEIHFRWIGIFLVSYIMTFVHGLEEGETLAQKYFSSLLFTCVYWNGAFMMFIYFRKKFPLIKQTPKRLVLTMVSLAAFLVIADPILCSLLHLKSISEAFSPQLVFSNIGKTTIAALIIGSFYENAYFFEQWERSIKINEALKNQQIRTQFEVLQNQMSPHFLFNSLNTLATLISEDPKVATEFTERLSEVYRYILQNKEKELVTLKEEIDFVKSYVFLLQMRYPENLFVQISVDEKYLRQHIAPLTLQILVENAIKHNIISKTNPLKIDIYVENGKSILVKNNLQQKRTLEKSTRTGLENIKKRYAYFGNRNIDVITTAGSFMVAIPLLQIENEKELSLSIS